MPNHIHIILWILADDDVGKQLAASVAVDWTQQAASLQAEEYPHVKPRSLSAIIRGYKSAVSKEINEKRGEKYPPVWHGRFYDRIIRNEKELNAIRRYIQANPQNWTQDSEWDEGLDEYLNDSMS